MNKILVICLVCATAILGKGQTTEIQQLQLNIEKLAQMKLMLAQMKEGYKLLETGYNSLRNGAKGNFDLHQGYLNGLLAISPTVRNSPEVEQALHNYAAAKNEYELALRKFSSCGLFNAGELYGLKAGWDRLWARMATDKKAMDMVLTNGALRMNDAERVNLLTTVNASSIALLADTRRLLMDYERLMAMRSQRKKDIEAFKRLRGIK
jgi:hypothetical protein